MPRQKSARRFTGYHLVWRLQTDPVANCVVKGLDFARREGQALKIAHPDNEGRARPTWRINHPSDRPHREEATRLQTELLGVAVENIGLEPYEFGDWASGEASSPGGRRPPPLSRFEMPLVAGATPASLTDGSIIMTWTPARASGHAALTPDGPLPIMITVASQRMDDKLIEQRRSLPREIGKAQKRLSGICRQNRQTECLVRPMGRSLLENSLRQWCWPVPA